MAFIYQADGEGTDAELLALAREMKARILKHGQSYVNEHGQTTTLPSLGEIEREIQRLEARINAESAGPPEELVRLRRGR